MGEKEDFVVEKKIKTEKDYAMDEQRRTTAQLRQAYAKAIRETGNKGTEDKRKKAEKNRRKAREAQKKAEEKQTKEKLNEITKNIEATKIQQALKNYRKKKLESKVQENKLLMEDFIILTKNNSQMTAGVFDEKKMKKTFDELKKFQKEQDKNIKILGEEKFNDINEKITKLFAEMKQLKDKKTEQSISQQSTMPSATLSGISGVSNSSVVVPTNIPKNKTNTQQIKL